MGYTNKQPLPRSGNRDRTASLLDSAPGGRVWGSKQANATVDRCNLPKTDKKWKPRPGAKPFHEPRQAKPQQLYKFYDSTSGKYIYASSKPKRPAGHRGKWWQKA